MTLDKFKYGLEFDTRQFSAENYKRFAEAIYKKNNVYSPIIGFVDGTMQKIACPNVNYEQSLAYNG
ncbi:hypothetical protein PHYBLDRAFT_139507 [Phycomyces blakesleeanus NRRL 1555(-)]|uniref:Uncharacterized protein n=1 Tax=Phycomyces blakesleeanus (strain ATCC 8743b / DSM 1359 / FGSC 10004 / NBRC 33097 / NRRL 1555) TaxID=763407 RepID=A0A162V266_PHYB8|nr:hypothetical protein PHYBLDRAFT_139507 [Phycomyces blakesleeanus NRRL 1555(-)]OAD79472.1 hypothetical protein PHYBLDRAFT_139507 [Phycomyces blakesleeanus NRRL 1555(-)]|eukprot:XP_018297512.1 hypothetical protein PHYBLDRAFT_139507 [Phycomyces blakesleeanus NRRL 1555(-)]